MGAWGHRNFENDEALDFIRDFQDAPTEVILIETLSLAAEAEEDDYLDLYAAGQALAAAEIVAASFRHPSADFPPHLNSLVNKLDVGQDDSIRELARAAVTSVLKESELQELWAEGGEPNEWQQVQNELLVRLGK